MYASLKAVHKTYVVVSNDSDATVSLLNHVPFFQELKLLELWVQAGVGDTRKICAAALPSHGSTFKLVFFLSITVKRHHFMTETGFEDI